MAAIAGGLQAEEVMVNRVSWKQIGLVQEPGRYMLRFGWVTVSADDLQVWSQFPNVSFALYEVSGESENEYRLGSVDLNMPAFDGAPETLWPFGVW